MNRYRLFGIASVLFLAATVIFSSFYLWSGHGASASNSNTYTQSQLEAVNVTSSGVNISQADSVIYINATSTLPVMMGPMNAGSMYSFEILGLINPHLEIRSGVTVHFTVVNVDNDSSHNFVVTSTGPPYPYMTGMSMMFNGSQSYMMPYLPPVKSGSYAYTNFSLTFSDTGTYWYLCTYPGHAEQGMYGSITVY